MKLFIKTNLAICGLLALALTPIFRLSAEPAACNALLKAGRYFAQQRQRAELTAEQWSQLGVAMDEQLDLADCMENDNNIKLEAFLGDEEGLLTGDVAASHDELCRDLSGLNDYYRDLHFGRRTVGRAYYDRVNHALMNVMRLQDCALLAPAPAATQAVPGGEEATRLRLRLEGTGLRGGFRVLRPAPRPW